MDGLLLRSGRLLLGVLAAALLILCCLLPADAETYGDFTYSVSDGKATVTKYTGSGGDVTVPETLGGCPVTAIGACAFQGRKGLASVTLPDSVTYIDDLAFAESGLTHIDLGSGLTAIGRHAFAYCYLLTSVNLPDSVTYIGECAFAEAGLTSAVLGDPVIGVDDYAFSACKDLERVSIGSGVASIGEAAFAGCTGLKEIRVSENNAHYSSDTWGVLYNKDQTELIAFPGGFGKGYLIPQSVTGIGMWAFYDCPDFQIAYYAGSRSQWEEIQIENGNDALKHATIRFDHRHIYVPAAFPSGCTQQGYTQYTCGCGANYRELLPAPGHKVEEGVCTVCGEEVTCDFTGDGLITDADAIYLLRHTLFPDSYPLNGNGEVSGDGQITDADAIYLLRYTLFPENYPLK